MVEEIVLRRILDFIWAEEGGLADRPAQADPGGITKHGISIRFAGSIGLDLDGDGKTTEADIRAIDRGTYEYIIRTHFVDPVLRPFPSARPSMALLLSDTAVHSGPTQSWRILQKALGALVDGRPGPVTKARLQAAEPQIILTRFCVARWEFLSGLPNYPANKNGWVARMLRVHAESQAIERDMP